MSIAASLSHFLCIIGGPDWYRFMGAGEHIAKAAEAGSWTPAILTAVIATIILGWAAYAFSGAGVLPHLPLLRTGLILIAAVLLLRAGAYFIRDLWRPDLSHRMSVEQKIGWTRDQMAARAAQELQDGSYSSIRKWYVRYRSFSL